MISGFEFYSKYHLYFSTSDTGTRRMQERTEMAEAYDAMGITNVNWHVGTERFVYLLDGIFWLCQSKRNFSTELKFQMHFTANLLR